MKEIYLLKSANEWNERGSSKLIAATADRHTLLVLIGGELLRGNMEYDSYTGEKAYMKFCEDLQNGIEAERNIKYGYVEKTELLSEENMAELKERYENLTGFLPPCDIDEEEFEM